MAFTQSNVNAQIIPGVNQSLSVRMGRGAAELSKPCFTAGTSRVARSRATKALGLRKRKAVSPQSPPSPNQESAVNPRTGKVALGPWLGPYETHTDAAASEPLFLDPKGNTYVSLTAATANLPGIKPPAETPTASQLLQPKQFGQPIAPTGTPPLAGAAADVKGANPAVSAAAAAATQQLYAMVGKVVQRQAAAAQAKSKGVSQWPGRGKPRGTGRCGSTMARAINQPRRN